MDLSKILSITGKGGLFKLLLQTKNSFIVESLIDEKRFPVFSHDGVSTLDNISIFIENQEDVSLASVFQSIFKKENGNQIAIPADNTKLKQYFEEILPNYDKERVYVSNIKKIFSWYNLLNEKKLIDLEDIETQKESDNTSDE